jgi:hypothetical protein
MLMVVILLDLFDHEQEHEDEQEIAVSNEVSIACLFLFQ